MQTMPVIADAEETPTTFSLREDVRGALADLGMQVGEDVWALESCASLWLVDVRYGAYQRLPRGVAVSSATLCGSWRPLADLVVFANGTFLVAPADAGAPAMRSRVHDRRGCACADHTVVVG
jgi:hypothetical protein